MQTYITKAKTTKLENMRIKLNRIGVKRNKVRGQYMNGLE